MMGRASLSRLGLVVLLTAVLGFVFAVVVSAHRAAPARAAVGIGVESDRPGGPVWDDGLDGTDADDDSDEDGDAYAPAASPDPGAIPIRDNSPTPRPRVIPRRPKSPLLALEEDPP